jgi:hypothetical protein
MVPFECPLQSREEEVAGRQVGTVGGVVQALTTEGGNMVDRCCCRMGSRIIQYTCTLVSELLVQFVSTWRQDHIPPPDGYGCLPGTHYSIALSLTQHCTGTACTMEVVHPTTNEEGCWWTKNTVTPHQFYAVLENKMGKPIFRLFYIVTRCKKVLGNHLQTRFIYCRYLVNQDVHVI